MKNMFKINNEIGYPPINPGTVLDRAGSGTKRSLRTYFSLTNFLLFEKKGLAEDIIEQYMKCSGREKHKRKSLKLPTLTSFSQILQKIFIIYALIGSQYSVWCVLIQTLSVRIKTSVRKMGKRFFQK